MRTTATSFNTKFFFFTRTVVQLLYIYLSLTLISGRSLSWKTQEITDDKTEVDSLRVICFVVSFFSILIYIALLVTASKFLVIKSKTEYDQIRN